MKLRSSLLWIAVVAAGPAAAEEQLSCAPTLVPCNYATHFTGKAHTKMITKVSAAADPDGKAREQVDEINVAVAEGGKVTCEAVYEGKAVKGEGRIAVERGLSMEDAPGTPWYSISIVCPDAEGELPSIDEAQIKTYKQADKTEFRKLEAKSGDDSEDEANGVTLMVRTDWSFIRIHEGRP